MKSIKINGLFNDASWWFRNVKINTFSHRTFQPMSECRPGKKSCLDCNRLVQMFLPRIPKKNISMKFIMFWEMKKRNFRFDFQWFLLQLRLEGKCFLALTRTFSHLKFRVQFICLLQVVHRLMGFYFVNVGNLSQKTNFLSSCKIYCFMDARMFEIAGKTNGKM